MPLGKHVWHESLTDNKNTLVETIMNPIVVNRIKPLLCLSLLVFGTALAQEVTDAEELVKQLEVKPQPTSTIRTRSITINVPNADQGRASFNTIQFQYDSATLTQESIGQLTELGKALAHERLANESFVIEGHADAHGDDGRDDTDHQ